MTIQKAAVLLHYCSFYITGAYGIRVPLDHDGQGIVASDDCINVGCLPWNEGETTITLGIFREMDPQGEPPRFDGMLKTPLRRVDLFDANDPEILSMQVQETLTRVRIWTNRGIGPDRVIVALG